MKKLNIVLVGSLILLCSSCYYDKFIEFEAPDNVSFAMDIQPIFNTNCVGCHNGVVADPDLREGMSFDELVPDLVTAFDAENSEFVNKLPGIGHPVDAGFVLNNEDIALIKAWIDQGAENN